ncbi:hypothetical protein F5141DRAFT_1214913 [Pisolithus sp. B1]|nr:hypothetical protein F5141DRAFT_1214913 [Pisolithus sp. B1]
MPRVASIPKPSADSVPNLNTCILCNCKIPLSQHVLASKWVKSGGVAGSIGSDGGEENLQPSTTNNPKQQCGVEPPEGWEEHMFSLRRDRRHSVTPHSSTTTPPILPSPSQRQESSLPLSSPPEDESDYSSSVVEEAIPSPPQSCQKCPRSQQKSKGKAIDTEDADVVDHGGHEIPHSKKSGCLSKTVLEEISHNILVAVEFGVKPSHTKLNDANLFHSWYWAMQPKPDGGMVALSHPSINLTSALADRNAINSLITKEYNSLMKDVPKDDLAARRERLKAVYDWIRVANAKTQFSGLAEAWSNLEDIEIVGVVMYIGQDPTGCQMSGIFGGSEVIRDFINEKAIDIQGLMDKYMAIFKCIRNGDGMEARLVSTSSTGDVATALELHCYIKETPRDCSCRVFGMMKEKLLAALRDICISQGIKVSDPQKVAWNWLLELMRKYHLTIDWPHSVSPPGPGFDHKKLKAGPLRQLVVPYLQRKLGHMYDGQTDNEEEQDSLDDAPEIEIKCWNQDIIDILDVCPLKGDIPLVKTANETILQKVSDDLEWQKSHQEEDRQWQSTKVQ